jgi:hypothetical protein
VRNLVILRIAYHSIIVICNAEDLLFAPMQQSVILSEVDCSITASDAVEGPAVSPRQILM